MLYRLLSENEVELPLEVGCSTEEVLLLIEQSVDIEDTNAVVLEHFGDVLVKKAEIEEAIRYFRKALEINPNNAVLRKKLSEL